MALALNKHNGVTAPQGYRACGYRCGIKPSGLDLALLQSEVAATVAGVFTTNKVQGATVKYCRELLRRGTTRALVVNSGNANACTGKAGAADARRMALMTSSALGIDPDDVMVCSTGVIGVALPMDALETGIPEAAKLLSEAGGGLAAEAIMTTDTRSKQASLEFVIGGSRMVIGGMAKGAGMVEPDMATMLAFLTTDADVDAAALQGALVEAVGGSFNRISIDGDRSCNDTVLLLANGKSGIRLDAGHPGWADFCEGLRAVCLDLAMQIVRDGEGATKFVRVTVDGAMNDAEAELVARTVANSLLVKTSWYGCDPNWGRVIDAVGYSGASLEESKIDIRYDDVKAVEGGLGFGPEQLPKLEAVLRQDAFTVTIDLNMGAGCSTVYTCDCSVDYVRINSDYTT